MIRCQEIAHVKPDAADTLRVFQRVLVVDAGLRLRLEVLVPRTAPKLYVRVSITELKMCFYCHERIAEIKKRVGAEVSYARCAYADSASSSSFVVVEIVFSKSDSMTFDNDSQLRSCCTVRKLNLEQLTTNVQKNDSTTPRPNHAHILSKRSTCSSRSTQILIYSAEARGQHPPIGSA